MNYQPMAFVTSISWPGVLFSVFVLLPSWKACVWIALRYLWFITLDYAGQGAAHLLLQIN